METPNPKNLATILTAPGVAAIAVIRLVGSAVDSFLTDHFSKPVPLGRCVHGLLTAGDQTIDDALVVRCAPEVLDLNLHGGAWVVRATLKLASDHGFDIVDSGTTRRAVDGATELWGEVLQALPLTRTEQAVRMLLAQPAAWEKMSDPASVIVDDSGHWMIHSPIVAIVGPANVGKSTLANQLFGQSRSITADLPGTTRDWVGEIANIDGLAVMLLDTPGVRLTEDPIEQAAIAGSVEPIRAADLIVLVLDQTLPLHQHMLNEYPMAIRVANKSDGITKWDAADIGAISMVATVGRGVDALRIAIRKRFGWEPMDLHRARRWTDRHHSL